MNKWIRKSQDWSKFLAFNGVLKWSDNQCFTSRSPNKQNRVKKELENLTPTLTFEVFLSLSQQTKVPGFRKATTTTSRNGSIFQVLLLLHFAIEHSVLLETHYRKVFSFEVEEN